MPFFVTFEASCGTATFWTISWHVAFLFAFEASTISAAATLTTTLIGTVINIHSWGTPCSTGVATSIPCTTIVSTWSTPSIVFSFCLIITCGYYWVCTPTSSCSGIVTRFSIWPSISCCRFFHNYIFNLLRCSSPLVTSWWLGCLGRLVPCWNLFCFFNIFTSICTPCTLTFLLYWCCCITPSVVFTDCFIRYCIPRTWFRIRRFDCIPCIAAGVLMSFVSRFTFVATSATASCTSSTSLLLFWFITNILEVVIETVVTLKGAWTRILTGDNFRTRHLLFGFLRLSITEAPRCRRLLTWCDSIDSWRCWSIVSPQVYIQNALTLMRPLFSFFYSLISPDHLSRLFFFNFDWLFNLVWLFYLVCLFTFFSVF